MVRYFTDGINFLTFTAYLLPGIIASGIATYIYLRLCCKDIEKHHSSRSSGVGCDSGEKSNPDQMFLNSLISGILKQTNNDRQFQDCHLAGTLGKSLRTSMSSIGDFEDKLRALSREVREHLVNGVAEPGANGYDIFFSYFQYRIRDGPLLIKSSFVMTVVIALFFLQPILELNLSPGEFSIPISS